MKTIHILAVIVAIALIIFGLAYPLPEKRVYVSGLSSAYDSDWGENKGAEYIGGDCYNYIIEASLKAGYMNGLLVMKAFSVIAGILLLFLALLLSNRSQDAQLQLEALNGITRQLDQQKKTLEALSEDIRNQTHPT